VIALDANVLVRFLVTDDRRQSEQAAALLERAIAASEMLFISDVVVCETVWVLSSAYQVPRAEIVLTLRNLVRARQLSFSSADRLVRALDAFADGRGDFADYLIAEQARDAGCEVVATFDRALLKERGFAAPSAILRDQR
jgi:predicted nucleic-acid-binding protein